MPLSRDGSRWRITRPQLIETAGCQRVSSMVGGEEVWFETNDARLCAAPEAFAGAFFLPALHRGATMEIDAPIDAKWLEGTHGLLPIYREWWGYAERYPVQGAGSLVCDEIPTEARCRAACFTGGVDSFHSLLRIGEEIDCLLYVHGYDIPLGDDRRMNAYDRSLREVARLFGKNPIVVRTNLREHPLFAQPGWDRTHGPALACVAHVLGPELKRLHIPSTYSYRSMVPWGSHWRTDPLWSSSRVEIEHGDASLGRTEKLLDIAKEQVVSEHLRVCFENLEPVGNCSRCDKCVRTMIALQTAGILGSYPVFDASVDLDRRIGEIGAVKARFLNCWDDVVELPLPPSTRAAIRRLLRRSRHRHLRRRFTTQLRRLFES